MGLEIMPNRNAKTKKQRRQKLNTKWAREGRTANQHKKWLKKHKGEPVNRFGIR